MTEFKLKPLEPDSKVYKWLDNGVYKRYALVGKVSYVIHGMFSAPNKEKALEVAKWLQTINGDSGYTVMLVDEDD
jgi:hypothetical protein